MLHLLHLHRFRDSSAVTTKRKQNIDLVKIALFCILPRSYSIKLAHHRYLHKFC